MRARTAARPVVRRATLDACTTMSYTTRVTPRANKPISVTLGPFAEKVERRLRDGEYASVSEVIRAGLRALDREDELFDQILRAKVQEALDDPRPPIPLEEAFERLTAKYEARVRLGN